MLRSRNERKGGTPQESWYRPCIGVAGYILEDDGRGAVMRLPVTKERRRPMSSNLPAEPRPTPPAALEPIEPLAALAGRRLPPDEDDDGPDFRRYIAGVLRYKWLLAVLTMVGAGVGLVLARRQSPLYEAQATVWIETGASSGGAITQGRLLRAQNWIDLIKSFVVLDSVVREQRLFLGILAAEDTIILRSFDLKPRVRFGNYELSVDETGRRWALALQGAGTVEAGAVGDSVGAASGFLWVPPASEMRPGRKVAFGVIRPREAALGLMARFDARIPAPPMQEGNFMRLKLVGNVPSLTASTLNAIAEQFVRVSADIKRAKLTEYSRTLGEQLERARADLTQAELALESFRVATITLPSEPGAPVASGLTMTQTPAMQNYFAMRTSLDGIQRDREALERLLSRPADSGYSAAALEAIPSVANASATRGLISDLNNRQANLAALNARYTPQNTLVQEAIRDLNELQQREIPRQLNTLLTELRTRERDLTVRVASAGRELEEIPQRAIEEERRRRERGIAENLYTRLQQNYSEARLAEAATVPDVRILDQAIIPDTPVKNAAPIMLVLGVVGGLVIGVVVALIFDRYDRRLRYPDQVTRGMGLSILGAVPRVRTNGAGLAGGDATQVVEALRSIRLNLVHAYGAAGPLITTVSSPGSGDGKSFIASNLALAFADAGHKTLLVDGDIRRGSLHRVLNVNRKPGLLDYLGGSATREQVVQKTRIAAVDFIGCGTRRMGGPELLASPAMSQLVIQLRSQYSVVIIDSAPLGAGVDPLVLGSLTGSLLLVLRTGVTDREMAAAKLDALDRLPIRILGAVLNDVKPDGVYRYYSYLSGYAAEDEVEAGAGSAGSLPSGK